MNFISKQFEEKNDLNPARIKHECIQLNKYCQVVLRESSLCKLLLSSQISHSQLNADKLTVHLERLDRQLSDVILEFLGIFHSFA